MAVVWAWAPRIRDAAGRSSWVETDWLGTGWRWLARVTQRPPDRSATSRHDNSGAWTNDTHASAADQGVFESFVRYFERQILNYLWRMTGDEQAAYDLTQEVFVRAWQRFETIRGYEQPRGWLFRVATNLALTHKSSRGRTTPFSAMPSLGSDAPGASDPARRFAESDHVRSVLLRLPAKRRAALVLREVYGLSTPEVGQALGMSETAVRMAISRAREQFRTLYTRGEG
jgi:RNA polymerase sigma-70 factor (ECF subfamily)